MNRSQKLGRRPWEIFPYLIVLAALVALGIIVYASGQRMLQVGKQLALEDAELMHWWYQNHRARLNAQTASLAYRVSDSVEFEALVEEVGLADHPGYLAWILPDQSVKAALNPSTLIGDPINKNKMFAFVPAVGQPAADFWHDDGQPYFISMAPVPAEQGGGVVVMQAPVAEDLLLSLAELTGREVMFYSFEGQTPLASSNPGLLSDPPRLEASWVKEVATGQAPDSTRTGNQQGGQIVGMTAFQDFGGISFSGYLALVEPEAAITQFVPQGAFLIIAFIALIVLGIGCFLLHRLAGQYLDRFRVETREQQRTFKLRMVGLVILFLLPALGGAGYIIARTSQESRVLDRRATQIAKDVMFAAFAGMTTQVEQFADSAPLQAESAAALADKTRLASGFDFALTEPTGELSYLGDDEFSEDALAQLMALEAGQVKALTSGVAVLLAAKQSLPDGTSVIGGYRLDKRIKNIADDAPVNLTLFQGDEPAATSLNDREIVTLTFDPSVEESLNQSGQASYEQKVHWYDSKLAASILQVTNPEQWRLIVSQASITWLNAVRSYQAFSVAILVTLLVAVGVLMTLILNQDHPLMLRRMITGYMFILPALIWLIWWRLGPALFTVFLSFHKWSVLDPAKPFVGWHNYRLITEDDKFWNAMWNTLVYTTQIPISMAISLALALALNQQLRGIRALRTIYYMPAVTSIVVVSLMWQLLYNKDLGVFNYLLSFVGLGPYGWLQSPTMAMPSIMGMSIWLALGAQMLLFLAGLQSIPNEYYEAAEVDGANPLRKFWHITLPLLAPTTFFVLVTSVIASFQVFGPIYVLTDGGPAGATDVAVYRIYFEAWQNLRFGYASAETVVLFAFLFLVTLLQFKYFGRRVSYG